MSGASRRSTNTTTRQDQPVWRSARAATRKAQEAAAAALDASGHDEEVRGNGTAGVEDTADQLERLTIGAGTRSKKTQSGDQAARQRSNKHSSLQASKWAPRSSTSTSNGGAQSESSLGPKAMPVEAGGLRPREMSRPLGGKLDKMSLLASPSRGLDANHLDGLLDGDITDLHIQLEFRAHISEQIRRHSKRSAATSSSGDQDEKQASLSRLILLARKLREGLLAGSSKGKASTSSHSGPQVSTTALLVDISILSTAFSLLSSPPNVAQLHATLPRLVDVLSSQGADVVPPEVRDRLRADIVALIGKDGDEDAIGAATDVLLNTGKNGLAHIVSLQMLLALYEGDGAARADGDDGPQARFGHVAYLALRARDGIDELDKNASIRVVHQLHRALLLQDIGALRRLLQEGEGLSFWHYQLLVSDETSPDGTESATESGPQGGRTQTANNVVGTTSNTKPTSAILDRFRAMVWRQLLQAYRSMVIPFPLELIPLRAPARSQGEEDKTEDRPSRVEFSSWLERTLLLDNACLSAIDKIRGRASSTRSTDHETVATRARRMDDFLSRPERRLDGADWVHRLDVRLGADGSRKATLRLK